MAIQNFIFSSPTKIIFGEGQVKELRNNISEKQKVLLVYGGGSIKENGIYNDVMNQLSGYDVVEFSGITSDAKYEYITGGVKLAQKEGVKFILAVGGGSVMSAAKFIALGAQNNEDAWEILANRKNANEALPIGCITTISGSGAEMNSMGSVKKERTREKLLFSHPSVYPKFAILDPTYTFTVPLNQISNGIVGTFANIIEQYLTYPSNTPVQDRFSEGILLSLIEEGPKALKDPQNYAVRANLMFASTISLNQFISAGVSEDWTSHIIAAELSALFGLDTGTSLAIILPSLIEIRKKEKREKLLQYAHRIWGMTAGTESRILDEAIQKTRDFFESLMINTRLRRYNIDYAKVKNVIDGLKRQGKLPLGENGDIDEKVVEDILKISL